ncbi:MAG: AI-2E family transporter [Candidatus Pacearchaeota archaeon]
MNTKNEFKNISIIIIIIILLILAIILLYPILQPILIGFLLVYLFYPLYKKILKITKEKNLAAFIIILIILLFLILPMWFLFPKILKQSFEIYLYLQKLDIGAILNRFVPYLTSTIIYQELIININKIFSSSANLLFNSLTNFILNIPLLLMKIAIVFILLFFGLRDSENIKNFLKSISPFEKDVEDKLIKNFGDITKSVIYGQIIIGLIQGILTGIGLFIFKTPQALFLTLIAIICGIIPILGPWIIWIPLSTYFFLSGNILKAIGIFLWGAILVSWIDNFLRPYIVSKKSKVSTASVFIGMIGGLITLGLIGLIIGPLLLSYLFLLIEFYKNKKNN